MSWTEGIEDGVYVVHLDGRLDGASASEFEKLVSSIFENNHKHIVLNMSSLDYISSAGLRVVLLLGKKVRSVKGVLVLCCLSPMVHEIFEVSGFLSLFPIANALSEAKKVCKSKEQL